MQAVINKRVEKADRIWLDKFKDIPSSIVSDCLNRYYAIGGDMRPIYENIRMVGFALTIQSMSGNNMMSHYALTFAEPGDILMIDAGGNLAHSVWGGIQAQCAQQRGVAGLVLDGAVRDVQEMRDMKFPVYCKGVTPAGPHKGWGDNVNLPIQCGGVPVSPGDLVIGDDDGVAVVPKDMIPTVYKEALKRLELEKVWVDKMNNGATSMDAVGLRSAFEAMDVDILE